VPFVPVVDLDQKPLMPTTPSRARRWIKSGRATPFWKHGIFCVRLNTPPSDRQVQPVAVGIDPGSKKEAFTVKSEADTFLNIQADAVQHVKKAVETRRQMRRARRYRKTPCRPNRKNRARGSLPPSTKARWQWKLRICFWLSGIYPITRFVVEDIKARTIKDSKKWNGSFSPLECGKLWFYEQLRKLAPVEIKQGWETKELRDDLGLKKSSDKLSEKFEAHCVDSWVLANGWAGGHKEPDNKAILFVSPLRFHRRQLHRLEPAKGDVRNPYGGTRSLGLKRGSLVKHLKWGLAYVGGTSGDRISLHDVETGRRLCQNAKPAVCRFLCFNSWRTRNGRKEECARGPAPRLRRPRLRCR
jgi:hypothetical protein